MPLYPPPATGGSGNVATDTIFDAKGDLAVGTGSDTASRLAVGTNDQVLMAASGQATGLLWGHPKHTSQTNYITGDVTMVTAGVFYDGGSLSLDAGTWLVMGNQDLLAATNASRTFDAKLWDGTTVFSRATHVVPGTAAAARVSLFLAAIVSPGSTTTYKISSTSTVNNDLIKHNTSTGTYLLAVRIA